MVYKAPDAQSTNVTYGSSVTDIMIFSALLVICAGNSSVTGEFPAQRPATRSFDIFFDKRLSKQSRGWWFETPSRPLLRYSNDLSWKSATILWISYVYFFGLYVTIRDSRCNPVASCGNLNIPLYVQADLYIFPANYVALSFTLRKIIHENSDGFQRSFLTDHGCVTCVKNNVIRGWRGANEHFAICAWDFFFKPRDDYS